MSLQIGRVSLPRTAEASLNGRTLSLSGSVQASTSAAAIALRQRLSGYVDNPDEPVVPLVWSVDTTLNGYYRVLSATVVLDRDRSYVSRGEFHFNWSATLEQVVGFQAPLVEGRFVGATRSNAHSITSTSTRTWQGIPGDAVGYYNPDGGSLTETLSSTSNGGEVAFMASTSGDAITQRNRYFDLVPSFYTAPGDWYDASCCVFINDQIAVGRQVQNTATSWVIANEVVKVEPGAGAGQIKVSHWTTAWESVTTYTLTTTTSFTSLTNQPHTVSVLRNSPECCVIRLTYDGTSVNTGFRYTLDISLRRGSRYAEFYCDSGATTAVWGIARTAATAATALTGGIVRTSADADGNKFILASPGPSTNELTNGAIRLSSTRTTFPFMIGCEFGSAVEPHDAQTQIYEYMGAVTERQTIVAR